MSLASIKPFFSFLRSVYSESDGTGSSTRVHIGLIILFTIAVGTSFAISVHHRYVTLDQFDSFLTAAGTFIVTTCGVLYGVNKAGAYLESKSSSQTPPGGAQ